MLPFLKNKHEGGTSGPVETIEREPDEGSDSYDMIDAIVDDFAMACGITDEKKKSHLKSAIEALTQHIQDLDQQQDSQETV